MKSHSIKLFKFKNDLATRLNLNPKSLHCQLCRQILAGLLVASALVLPGRIHAIVTPCIQVVKVCAYPPTFPTCFPAGANIDFIGYVTNCGDIRLTDVTVVDGRSLLGA